MGMMHCVPWWLKITAKLILARLPLPYGFWRRLGLFRHGEMNRPARAINTFRSYYERAQQHTQLPTNFISLEIGPGDSILSGLVARSYGASQAWLVDAGHFATTDLAACKQTAALLEHAPDISSAKNLDDVLAVANIHYLTQGTTSLACIPDASVDFIWSQVVLEHVPRDELPLFFKELRRIIKPSGIGVHSIDFRDHLGGGLNNLRFNSKLWESKLFHSSGFYTNRIRPRAMIAFMEQAGFRVQQLKETRWPAMPIPRAKLANEFKPSPDDDFMVAEIEIITLPAL